MPCPPACLQIGQLDEKLAELEQERAELAEYQQHDRQRRSLQFTIWDREITKIKAEVDKVGRGVVWCGYGCHGVGWTGRMLCMLGCIIRDRGVHNASAGVVCWGAVVGAVHARAASGTRYKA